MMSLQVTQVDSLERRHEYAHSSTAAATTILSVHSVAQSGFLTANSDLLLNSLLAELGTCGDWHGFGAIRQL